MRARSALFTLFGDVVRPLGGEAWLSAITAAMGTVGINPQAVRTALHRMAAEGWVEPRKEGRYAAYRLTGRGEDRLNEAAERIYRLGTEPWDGRWRVVLASGLDPDGEVAAELEWIGYGRVQPGVWVSPRDHGDAVTTLLRGADAGAVTELEAVSSAADSDLAGRAWDLAALRVRHEAFLADWATAEVPADGESAFATRLRLVHEWRGFLFSDPGLPEEVLPDDWLGTKAAEVFTATHAALLPPSQAWYTALPTPG